VSASGFARKDRAASWSCRHYVSANWVARYAYDEEGNLDCVVIPFYSGSCVAVSATQLIKDYTYDYLNRLIAFAGNQGGSSGVGHGGLSAEPLAGD
jgi:hypothetical protein